MARCLDAVVDAPRLPLARTAPLGQNAPMKQLVGPVCIVAVWLAAAFPYACAAQSGADDPRRRKPVAELARLAPFVGTWATAMDRKGKTLPGTMVIEPVVNGWYLERTNRTRSEDGALDSEIRSLITWDPARGYYRIWRFVQLVPQDKHDGVGRFEDGAFVEEYAFPPGDPERKILRNRISLHGPDEMRIVSEIEGADGTVAVRGVVTARRAEAAD